MIPSDIVAEYVRLVAISSRLKADNRQRACDAIHAIWESPNGMRIEEIADVLGIERNSAYGWIHPKESGSLQDMARRFNEREKKTGSPARLRFARSLETGRWSIEVSSLDGLDLAPMSRISTATTSIESLAGRWADSGYDYEVIVEMDRRGELRRAIRSVQVAGTPEDDKAAFCLVSSLYLGEQWQYWVEACRRDPFSVRRCIALLQNVSGHVRPALRAVIALCHVDEAIIRREAARLELASLTVQLLGEVVYRKRGVEHLKYLKAEGGEVGKKAAAVLDELSDLPLPERIAPPS